MMLFESAPKGTSPFRDSSMLFLLYASLGIKSRGSLASIQKLSSLCMHSIIPTGQTLVQPSFRLSRESLDYPIAFYSSRNFALCFSSPLSAPLTRRFNLTDPTVARLFFRERRPPSNEFLRAPFVRFTREPDFMQLNK